MMGFVVKKQVGNTFDIEEFFSEKRRVWRNLLEQLKTSNQSNCPFDNWNVYHNSTVVDDYWKKHKNRYQSFATNHGEMFFHPEVTKLKKLVYLVSCEVKKKAMEIYFDNFNLHFPNIECIIQDVTLRRLPKLQVIVPGEDKIMDKDGKIADGIYLNSPYSIKSGKSTNTIDVYPQYNMHFKDKARMNFSGVCPRNDMSQANSSYRKFLLGEDKPSHLGAMKNWDDAQINTMWYTYDYDRDYTGTTIQDTDNNSIDIDVNENTVITWGDINLIKVLNLLKNNRTMERYWTRGKLHLNEDHIKRQIAKELATHNRTNELNELNNKLKLYQSKQDPNGTKFILTNGKEGEAQEIVKIKSSVRDNETEGFGYSFISIGNLGDESKLGPIKINDTKDYCAGHSVVIFKTTETKLWKDWLEYHIVTKIIKAIKTTTANAKYIFEYVPVPKKSWLDKQGNFNDKKIFDDLGLDQNDRKIFK